MTNEKFEDIWDNIILKLFDEITPQKDVFIASRSKYKIYKEYQKQKTFLKLNYMENPNTHLDRHKIAACMLYAIVKVQPIRIKKVHWQKLKYLFYFSFWTNTNLNMYYIHNPPHYMSSAILFRYAEMLRIYLSTVHIL